MNRELLLNNISKYRFYQTIDLGGGVRTPGLPTGPKQREVLALIEAMDLEGKRVLDLGCANGLFALAAKKQGAQEITAIDHTRQNIEALTGVIIPHLNSKIKALMLNLFDFDSAIYGKFDVVIFAGILYHLKYPFWALRIVRDLVKDGGVLILETGILDDFNRRAVLHCPSRADSPQKSDGNSCSFFNEKALYEALEYFGFRIHSRVFATKTVRRLAKKLVGAFCPLYNPYSNIVMYCERDYSMNDQVLTRFYESTR
jgi:SAM-dependent methyltransferase